MMKLFGLSIILYLISLIAIVLAVTNEMQGSTSLNSWATLRLLLVTFNRPCIQSCVRELPLSVLKGAVLYASRNKSRLLFIREETHNPGQRYEPRSKDQVVQSFPCYRINYKKEMCTP